ncbi:MAG TPA: glycosyltransferase family 1 protein [Actinomycetota bacterium]|nr:glycosyltransferase family 1 protein [Actinomycetota bacterium]
MRAVLLDERMDVGGVGRYSRMLHAGIERDGRFDVRTYRRKGLLDAPFTPWGRFRVGVAAKRARVDIVHGLHVEPPLFFGGPKVVTIHDLIPLLDTRAMPNRGKRILYRRLLEYAIGNADRIIVPSERTALDVKRSSDARPPVVVIPMAVDPLFRPLSEREASETRARVTGGAPYVLVVTGSKAHKNAGVLEDVIPAVRRAAPVSFVVLGWDVAPPMEGVNHLAGLSDDALRRIYGAAELCLVPSLMEGFGFPVVEAAACGTPVVCSPGLGAVESAADATVTVDVGDAGALSSAILDLLDDGEVRERLSVAGARIGDSLTIERMAATTVDVYRAVLGET